MKNKRRVWLTPKEYTALMDIRGLPENVHFMVCCSEMKNGRQALDGDPKTFQDLLGVISEEIAEELCPRRNVSALVNICKKVDPESLDWIGM